MVVSIAHPPFAFSLSIPRLSRDWLWSAVPSRSNEPIAKFNATNNKINQVETSI
jgi:hypothetical protein